MLLTAIVMFVAGAVGGYWIPARVGLGGTFVNSVSSSDGEDATADTGELWYTCGMHPNVLQRGPGDCPICQMKLTPLKKDDGAGGETRMLGRGDYHGRFAEWSGR